MIYQKNNAVFIAHSRTDVLTLIAEVERLRKENEGARRAAASFKAWDLAGDVDRLTYELEAAEAHTIAAEAKLADLASSIMEDAPIGLTQQEFPTKNGA